MRNKSYFLSLLLLIGIFFSSCIKDEALNTEADIETASISKEFLLTAPIITNNKITFRVSKSLDLTQVAPNFTLTKGASIVPANGTVRDFSQGPLMYRVTSENQNWSKNYIVEFINAEISTIYHFETFREEVGGFYGADYYHIISEMGLDKDGNEIKLFDWASGNPGYVLTDGDPDNAKKPSDFPTSVTPDGFIGNGIKLTTLSTEPLGPIMGSPLAAGNLFLGEFDLATAVSKPLKGTKFGYDFNYEPTVFRGFFKYTKGKDFQINNKEKNKLSEDRWDAYAILFEGDTEDFLYGDHDFIDEKIVSIARVPDELKKETNTWTLFEIPFTYVEGKYYDSSKKYKLAIVFSSSEEGSLFNGAIGSTLYIDEVEILKN
ncbi:MULTISPECIES: PCMD domain-containing protein [unclassified Myroides]|uniref:PCMD domain-containing protein n=1 Tax=unclassified Myroides TaxID=2642485 RepID=UPI0015F859C7|nr:MULTISPECIES: PCMD domain-containing protein [unclassified Myroides]MBB1149134.1 PCMD domain-containing protein [Myroides sp. NP-2]MDM1406106.1 PCMD domain-containing protein [Myroides sp. DF42-4-2]